MQHYVPHTPSLGQQRQMVVGEKLAKLSQRTLAAYAEFSSREHAIEVLSTSRLLSLPTPTNTFNQLDMNIFSMHEVHLNSGPGRSGPLIIPLHFLRTHSKEPPQKIVFLPALVRHRSGFFQQVPPNRYTTLKQCRINVDATS